MKKNNGRLSWIDNCKALAICCVIFFHESQFWNWGGDVVMPLLHRIVASFIMPIFVMISGYCGLNSLKKNSCIKEVWVYNFKNFKRIYLPSLSLSILLCMLKFEQFSTIKGVVGGSWFLTMLFTIMFVSSFLWLFSSKIVPNNIYMLFIPLTLITLLMVNVVHIGEMIPYYLIGIVIKETDAVNKFLNNKKNLIIIVLVTITMFSILDGTGLLNNKLGTFYKYDFCYFLLNGCLHYWLLRLLLSTLICFSIIALFYSFSGSYTKFSWIGSKTLSLYLFSCIPMYIWYNRDASPMLLNERLYNFICDHELTLYIANTLTFLLTIVFCLLLSNILEKWKYTRLLFLGKD